MIRLLGCICVCLLLLVSPASANLVDLGPGSFTPQAPVITFDTGATTNPTYTFTAIPGLGDVTVSFAGSFVGQTITGGFPRTLTGNPSGPLALGEGITTRTGDGAPGATSPILSGDPIFNGPISVLFSQPVAAVGLKGGFFDAIGGTSISAFDANGLLLGTITNTQTGFQFYGLKDSSGANVISGISFYITGNEPAGFEIDDVTFGSVEQVTPDVPEPASVLLFCSGVGSIVAAIRRRRS